MASAITFYRLIPESEVDNNPTYDPPNKRKVSLWVNYGDWRKNMFYGIGLKYKKNIKTFEKIFCTSDKFCENQICKRYMFVQPKCPYARYFKITVDRRTKMYQTFLREWQLEAWEYFGCYQYEWIDIMKQYANKPIEDIPDYILTRLRTYFRNTAPNSEAYSFFKSYYFPIIRQIEEERAKEKKVEKEKEFKAEQILYKLADNFYGEYTYLGDIKDWLTPRRASIYQTERHPITNAEWEQYRGLTELPKENPFSNNTTKDTWYLYRAFRLIEERFFTAPVHGRYGIGGNTRFLVKKEGLPHLRKFLEYFLEFLETPYSRFGRKQKDAFSNEMPYIKMDEFYYKTKRLISEIDEVHPIQV
jgi:hypothetical protein